MVKTPPFLEEPDGTRGAIMTATYHALCEHGYANLTIQRIADQFDKSKSLLYHHYDSKDDILLDFLEFMLDEFEEHVPRDGTDTIDSHLDDVLDELVAGAVPVERHEFMKAMVELRAQAVHDDRYRDHFARHDRFFQSQLADDIRTGIEEGVFRDVDPHQAAALLLTTITGSITQRATTETDISAAVREEIEAYVNIRLKSSGSTDE